jgi:outer membrane receptor for ferrienterochelin and colicin
METHFRSSATFYDAKWKIKTGALFKQIDYQNTTELAQVNQTYSAELQFYRFGMFVSGTYSFAKDKIDVSLGFRFDDDTYTAGKRAFLNLSPRTAISFKPNEYWKFSTTAGRYYKIPPYTVLGYQNFNNEFVNKNVKYIQSDHLGLGIERYLGSASSVSVEGFYKQYDNYPVSVIDQVSLANKGADFEVLGNEEIESIGKGRTYGIEFFYQQKLVSRFYGVLSFTYFYSEFTGFDSNEYLPSLWDSRYLASFTGGYQFKRNWELSARYRFAGETPFVPVNESTTILIYPQIALDYSNIGIDRLGAFNQLDVRVDKKWNKKSVSLNIYFEVQNLLAQNSPSPNNYVLETDDMGDIIEPRNLIEVDAENNTPIPTFGLVIDF